MDCRRLAAWNHHSLKRVINLALTFFFFCGESTGIPMVPRRFRWNWQNLFMCLCFAGRQSFRINTLLCCIFFCSSRSFLHPALCWEATSVDCINRALAFSFWLALANGSSAGGLEEPVPCSWIYVARAVLCFVSRSWLLFSGPLCQPATVTDLSEFW